MAIALVIFGTGYKLAQIQMMGISREEDVFWDSRSQNREVQPGDAGEKEEEKQEKEIVVHVVGAVEKPGVYKLPAGSRVVDAVDTAVPSPDARLELLNLAAPLLDGQQVVVLSEEDYQELNRGGPVTPQVGIYSGAAFSPAMGSAAGGTGGSLININTAGQSELETLPGIGPSLAQRIIDYRNANGPFLSPEDIKNVSGIGDKRFEQIKDKITVR